MNNPKMQMIDLSSNNGPVNLKKLWATGYRVLALKVTEGTGYLWGDSHTYSAAWHNLGGAVLHYHFLTPGNGAQQADNFWAHVQGDLGVGDRFVVDCETNGENGAEVNAFIDRMHTHAPHVRGLVYGGPYFLRDHGITGRDGWEWWCAEYAPKIDFVPPGFPRWLAWQYTQTGIVAGVAGNVDLSHLRPPLVHFPVSAGQRSYAVADAKRLLHKLGYYPFPVYTQGYGGALVKAVAKFKRKHGWPANGRGIGDRMWRVLEREANR